MSEMPLKLSAYMAIKERILYCAYAPGALINEETLKSELGMSRTPIRDALSRLEQEGLIAILPKVGIMVSEMSIKDINELYEARLRIEPFAVRNYGSQIDDATYESYYRMFSKSTQDSTPQRLYEIDDAFHRLFLQATKNRYLISFYEIISGQVIRTRVASGQMTSVRLDYTQSEHQTIAKACLKRDWESASQAMRDHILMSKDAILEIAATQPERFHAASASNP